MAINPWFTAALGWMFGGPIGAVFGAAIGHFLQMLEKGVEKNNAHSRIKNREAHAAARRDFYASLMVLAAAVMKADGRPKKEELAIVKNFLVEQFGSVQAQEALYILRDLLKKNIPVEPVCQQIRANMNYSQRLALLHFLHGVAHADQEFHDTEKHLLEQIAMDLGIRLEDRRSIAAMFAPRKNILSDYRILEVEPNATDDEIRKAFRRMSMKHHPDKVAHLGSEIQKNATEKFQSISAAYERIKKKRGMS